MSLQKLNTRRPFFRTILVIASLIAVVGILWIILINWFGLIYIASAAFFFWQACMTLPGRRYPRPEDVHPPSPSDKRAEDEDDS